MVGPVLTPTMPSDLGSRGRARSSPPGESFDAGEFQGLPPEILQDIAASGFLDSPLWHLCQLGGSSPSLGQVFQDQRLWGKYFQDRFHKVQSQSPKTRKTADNDWRRSYAELHSLERRFSSGSWLARDALPTERRDVPVLDLRVAPCPDSTMAFAALRDGAVVMYDLDAPQSATKEDDVDVPERPLRAAPLRELTPPAGNGSAALCCLPLKSTISGQGVLSSLAAGYADGQLCAWSLPAGRPTAPGVWTNAHNGRVTALCAPWAENPGGLLLSASADGLIKGWDLSEDRFGDTRGHFVGHSGPVTSLAAPSCGGSAFLSSSHDRTIRIWDQRTQEAELSFAQLDWAMCAAYHPVNPNQVLSCDKAINIWDLRITERGPLSSLHRHRKLISMFRVNPLRLASCSLDGTVKVSSLEEPTVQYASPRNSPALTPQRDPLCTWNCSEATEVSTLCTSTDYVLCIDFDETRLLAGGVDGHVEVFDFSDRAAFRARSASVSSPRSCSREAGTVLEGPVNFQMDGLEI